MTDVVYSIGRRKESVARVRVMVGSGVMIVNDKPITEVYKGVLFQKKYNLPLDLTRTLGKITATILVKGGGYSSQIDAIVLGLSRALVKIDQNHKMVLRQHGLLTRDSRVRERRKPGLGGRARAKKQSPKR